jgi:predicted anti-sigma-YlaC factor YlaD
VAYAEAFCVPKQDAACFGSALEKALAVDPYRQEAGRLQNVLAQRRARLLLERKDDLILPAAPATEGER